MGEEDHRDTGFNLAERSSITVNFEAGKLYT